MKYSFYVLPNALTKNECNSIIESYSANMSRGTIGVSESADAPPKVRNSNINWMNDSDPMIDKIMKIGYHINRLGYGYDLFCNIINSVQITEYDSSYEGHYESHIDCGFDDKINVRKMSMVIQLSDPDNYEGGDLIVGSDSMKKLGAVEPGTAIAFPSYLSHKVTPVTNGKRYSLVTWMEGPTWR